MTPRAALPILLVALLAGCASTGEPGTPVSSKARVEAVQAYVQLGLGYLKQGLTERAKWPLKKALELNADDADAHAALALVFQSEMEPKLADQHFRKSISLSKGEDGNIHVDASTGHNWSVATGSHTDASNNTFTTYTHTDSNGAVDLTVAVETLKNTNG